MPEQTFEYKTLRFLNDRIELYTITDHSLKIALYDFSENEYVQGINLLRQNGYVKNKELYEQGLTITRQGQVRLQQLQQLVDKERFKEAAHSVKYPLGLREEVLWGLLIAIIGGAFALGHYFGVNKFDQNLIELSNTNHKLNDSLSVRNITISLLRHNSDSALNILGHMPYDSMHLDTMEFRKVQTTLENAGAVLYLNK